MRRMKFPQKYVGIRGVRTTRWLPASSTWLPLDRSRARSVRKPSERAGMPPTIAAHASRLPLALVNRLPVVARRVLR